MYNKTMESKTYLLNNGMAIPQIGFGTYRAARADCEHAVEAALRSGYRLIDTANVYMNERAVGRGIANSGIERGEIVLASKIWPTEYKSKKATEAIDRTLSRLGADHLDLLLLHQPFGRVEEAWKAAEDAVRAGKVRMLGVSNFDENDLEKLLGYCTIKPVLDQVECHPYCQRRTLAQFLRKNGNLLESWYPLGNGDTELLGEKTVMNLSEKYKKTPVQIVLCWHVEEGYLPIPGTKNPKHAAENFNIFDFSFTNEEMSSLRSLDRNERLFRMKRGIQKYVVFLQRMNYDRQK